MKGISPGNTKECHGNAKWKRSKERVATIREDGCNEKGIPKRVNLLFG